MKLLLQFLLLVYSISSFSQTINGKVVDEKKVPLAGANIYFDGTTIATISDENGNFKLNYSSKINSVLAVSFIGFQTFYLRNFDSQTSLIITLLEANDILNEVVIKKDRFSRKQKMTLFKEQFIGRTSNSKSAKILNEDVIYFDYDEKEMILKAYSDVPLLIKNEALGYEINYELVDFEAVLFRNTMKSNDVGRSFYAGLSRFKEVVFNDKVKKKRAKCYEGSQFHFFRNLVNNIWDKNNFLLFKGSFQENPANCFTVIKDGDFKKVTIIKQIKSLRNSRFVAEFNLLFNKKQQSRVIFETDTFYVDLLGNNSNIEDIIFSGHLSELKVGDMLPMNYGIE